MTEIKTQEIVRFKCPAEVENKSILTETEIPQAQEMIPLTDCLDDKGVALSSDIRRQLSNGLATPYLRYPSGVEEFQVPTRRDGSLTQVPRGTTLIRAGSTLGGIPRMSGGSI